MTERDVLLVRGVATRSVPADRAVVQLTVSASGARAADVERELAESAAALDAVLDTHADAIGSIAATSVRIRPNTYWHPESGREVRDGFVGERSIEVRLDDPIAVGLVVRSALDAAQVEVAGPSWQLIDDHPVHAEVRVAAAADARSRAEAYAAGLGVAVGSVAFVAEPGLRSGDPGGGAEPFAKLAAVSEMADAGGGAVPIGLPRR